MSQDTTLLATIRARTASARSPSGRMSSDGYPLRYRLLLMTDPTHPDDGHDGWATLGWDDDE